MESVAQLKEMCRDAAARKIERFSEMFSAYPVDLYVENIENVRKLSGYRSLNQRNAVSCSRIESQYSVNGKYVYHQVVILNFIISSLNKIFRFDYTDFVKEQILREYYRIVQDININSLDFYDFKNDLFCKDLAISSLRMYPVGLLKVEYSAGIPRRYIFSHKCSDFFRWILLINKTKALSPFHEIHLDVRYKCEFSPEGWKIALRRVGEMVARNPCVKGITGGSWFFDPRIREISPHLAYLRQIIEGHGGLFFASGRNHRTTELAISKSKTRKRMYDSGDYDPMSYYMIWPRSDVVKWTLTDS